MNFDKIRFFSLISLQRKLSFDHITLCSICAWNWPKDLNEAFAFRANFKKNPRLHFNLFFLVCVQEHFPHESIIFLEAIELIRIKCSHIRLHKSYKSCALLQGTNYPLVQKISIFCLLSCLFLLGKLLWSLWININIKHIQFVLVCVFLYAESGENWKIELISGHVTWIELYRKGA